MTHANLQILIVLVVVSAAAGFAIAMVWGAVILLIAAVPIAILINAKKPARCPSQRAGSTTRLSPDTSFIWFYRRGRR
jgi:hypothetical protein